jgi:hypothetical protein
VSCTRSDSDTESLIASPSSFNIARSFASMPRMMPSDREAVKPFRC